MKTKLKEAELRKKRNEQFKLKVLELRKEQDGKLLTLAEICALTGYSIPTIYRLQKLGKFPHSIRCDGSRSVRWSETEYKAWLDYRMAKQHETFYASQQQPQNQWS